MNKTIWSSVSIHIHCYYSSGRQARAALWLLGREPEDVADRHRQRANVSAPAQGRGDVS